MRHRDSNAVRDQTPISEPEAASIFLASDLSMVLTDPSLPDNPIIYVNDNFERLTGYTAKAAIGQNCRFLQGAGTSQADVDKIREALLDKTTVTVVLKNYRASGEPFWNALLITPVMDAETENIFCFLGVQEEVKGNSDSDQFQLFERLVTKLQDRVKDHLSFILGIMRQRGSDAHLDSGKLASRIRTLQLLYEEVPEEPESAERTVDLGAYLGRIAASMNAAEGKAGVRLNVSVEPVFVDTDTALRVGLVTAETLQNALRHAFDGRTNGLVELRLSASQQGPFRVVVMDDGPGLPETLNWPDERTEGGRIVARLIGKLDATLEARRGVVGTTVVLEVSVPA